MQRRLFAALIATALLAGCATSSIVVGKRRSPISPDDVKLYLHPPKKYEEVAIVEATSKNSFSFSDQGKTDATIDRMKSEAAKLGANGVLLSVTGKESTGAVSVGATHGSISNGSYNGVSLGMTSESSQRIGKGLAIYVEEE